MHIKISRTEQNDKQTLGLLTIHNGDIIVATYKTLELPWKDNARRISRIPPGTYEAVKHVSPKFGECLWLVSVQGRSEILIHKGNFHRNTLGCILVGFDFRDIDGDGYDDVTHSEKAMSGILKNIESDSIQVIVSDLRLN